VRGGIYSIVEALVRRLDALGGELRCGVAVRRPVVRHGQVTGAETEDGFVPAGAVLWNGDASRGKHVERSLSGFALMLGVRGTEPAFPHHTILFPRDYGAEFDDVFEHRRPVRDPTLYLSVASATDPSQAPPGHQNVFVLANAPARGDALDWDAYEQHMLERLAARGYDFRERIVTRARRTPTDLERETAAIGGAIYGAAPHGRLGTLKRPPNEVRGVSGLYRVGGTTHPGGGLPLVMLSAKIVADAIGR
jgi:phytoene dehydrogenase-like protein